MAANMTNDLLNNDMDFMLSECSPFNPTCDAQMRTGIHLLNVVWLKYDHFFIAKLIIFVAYVNWALFFFYRPTVYVHWTETNLSSFNKKKNLVKLKKISCVFMSSAWTNTWSWGSLCQSFCLFYSVFQCRI
jgi:hypothetical protein